MENQTTGSGTSERPNRLPQDELLELLSDERRRYLVTHLQEATAPVAVADLARLLADRESEQSPTAVPDHQDAVHRSLHHCHVPKLAAAGVVDVDRDLNAVEPGANFESVVELWNSLSDVADPA